MASSILASHFAYAAEVAFNWPESYSIVDTETNKSDPNLHFVNTYRQSGRKARNDNTKFGTDILRLDDYKELRIHPDSKIEETELPADYPISNMFPKDRDWELLGDDTLSGNAA